MNIHPNNCNFSRDEKNSSNLSKHRLQMNLLEGLCQDWMSLFHRGMFTGDLEPTAGIVKHGQAALTMVYVKGVFQ